MFTFDRNGNALRFVGKNGKRPAPHQVGALWDDQNRMTQFIEGEPNGPSGLPVESFHYDPAGYRWLALRRDGVPEITLRDAEGRTLAEYRIQAGASSPQLKKEFVYALGQLVAERTPSTTPPMTFMGLAPGTGASSQLFSVTGGANGGTYDVDVRTDAGSYRHLSGITLDAQNRFQISNSDLAPDVTNYVRIKHANDEAAIYSAPVALTLDSSVTPSSANQVKSLVVSWSGNNIVLSWGLGTTNNKQTKIYFRRLDTGAEYVLTPAALNASVTSYTLNSQAIAGPCVSFFAKEVVGLEITAPSRAPLLPTTHKGIGSVGVPDGSPCAGSGGGSPGDPGDTGGSGTTFANVYHHRDHLGSLRVVTDDSGAKIEGHDYLPFGADVAAGNSSNRLFTGHQRDTSSGLDYMLARYHSPGVGRFLSVDPGMDVQPENPQSWNLFPYVRSNPVNATDPDGRFNDVTCGAFSPGGNLTRTDGFPPSGPSGPPATTRLSLKAGAVGLISGGEISLNLNLDNKGGSSLTLDVQAKFGFGVEVQAGPSVSVQPGTVTDIKGGESVGASGGVLGEYEIQASEDGGSLSRSFKGFGVGGSVTKSLGGPLVTIPITSPQDDSKKTPPPPVPQPQQPVTEDGKKKDN